MADLLSPSQVQKEFGYSPASLRRWEDAGRIRSTRTPGNQRRYARTDLEALDQSSVAKAQERDYSRTYDELGSSGLTRFGGSVFTEEMRELRGQAGRKMYREMRLNDPVIGAVIFAVSHALKQADWRVQPASEKRADKQAADFLQTCLDDMSFTWSDTLTFAIDGMLEQGVSLLEPVYKRRLGENPPAYVPNPAASKFDDGRIGWRKLAPRPVESLTPGAEWDFDEHGGIAGVNQTDPATGTPHYIPMNKLLMFRTTVYPANTPEPPPIHRAAYLPYWYTSNLQEIEGIGIERDLNGIPVLYLGSDCSVDGPNSDYEMGKDLVVNIRRDEQTGVVIPKAKMGGGAAEGKGMLLELLSSSQSRALNTGEIIERYDRRKALVVLAQFIMLGMNQVGSFALSQHQGDLFILAVSAWIRSIADVFNRFAVPKLFKLNVFPGISAYPELVPSAVGVPNLVQIAEYVNKLVDKAVLTPDMELERHLRQLASLPERVEPEEPAIPTEKAIVNKAEIPTNLTPQGQKALAVTIGLEDKIRAEWRKLTGNINGGMDTEGALALYRRRVDRLLDEAFDEAWLIGRGGEFSPTESGEIDAALVSQREYLDAFMEQLAGELGKAQDKEEKGGILLANLARAVMYAGSVWALYNAARIFGADRNELWRWEGPMDSSSCPGCVREMQLGARPLKDIKVLPGQADCLSNCRHELIRAR